MSSHHRRTHSQPQILPSPTKSTNTTTAEDGDEADRLPDHRGGTDGYGWEERGEFQRDRVGFAIGGESDEDGEEGYEEPGRNGFGGDHVGLAPPLETFDYPRQMSRDPTPGNSPLYPPRGIDARSPFDSKHSLTSTPPSDASHAPHTTSTSLPSHLTLLPRLTLCILTSLPLLSLLLIILPTLLSSSTSFTDSLTDLQTSVQAKCLGVQAGVQPWLSGQGEANLWNVLRVKEEEAVRRGVVDSLLGLESILNDSLTIMEQVIDFIIETYRSLLVCTIDFAVQGTLALLIAAVGLISTSVTSSLNTIRTSIQSDVASANSLIQTAVTSINSVTSVVDVTLTVPQFTIPSLSALENVTFPTTIQDDLIKLNASIPDLAGLKTLVDTLVNLPFEELRIGLNVSFANLIADVNGTTTTNGFNTTSTIALSTDAATNATSNTTTTMTTSDFCADLDTSFLTNAANAITRMSHITAGLLVLAFVLLLAGLMAWEWYQYKCMVDHAAEVERTMERDSLEGRRVDGMRIVNVVEHPVLERYLDVVLDRVTRDERKRDNIRWFLSYITHITALALLAFGILSLITVQLQIDAVTALRASTLSDSSSAIETEADDFATSLNNAALGQSQSYADEMNGIIQGWQTTVDEDLFGTWLNTTTVVLNSTLVGFYSEVESLLDDAFAGTILAAPINTFVYCILGSKVADIEIALTWINEHAQLTLPTIANDALILPASTMQALVTPIVAAATGSGASSANSSDGLLGTLFDRYLAALARQRTMAGLFIALYGVIVLIGLAVFTWYTYLESRFIALRLRRLQSRGRPGGAAHLAQSGRGKTWSYTPSTFDKEKATQMPGRGSSETSNLANEKSARPHTPTGAIASKGMRPLILGISSGGVVKDRTIPRISYPVVQDDRPALGKHLSRWSTKAKTLLHVPAARFGGGADLDRNASQRSERSWTGMEPSPWVERGPQHGVPEGDETSNASSPRGNAVFPGGTVHDTAPAYPSHRDERYPSHSKPFQPDPLTTRTPIADSYRWTDSAVRKMPPLAALAPDQQHHRADSFGRAV